MFHVEQVHDEMLGVSRETLDRLVVFADLLTRWNDKINLISPRDVPQLWERHIKDSLQLTADLGDGGPFIDLGSGGGFPGLILSIATGSPVTLVEADHRKASFLREAARATGAAATVCTRRIEDASLDPVAFVTARALAPLPKLLDWASRLLLPTGQCLFLKGRSVEDELTAAAREWHMTVFRRPSVSDPEGVILKLSEIRRVRQPDREFGR